MTALERKASTARSVLEQILVDETADPKALQLSLLEDITGDFSDDQEIGRGGFAVVYKGILGDRAVAVKKLSKAFIDDKEYHREVECLMRAKHKNVVRFLGYCADTQGSVERYNEKLVIADVQERLLCFEYIPKGSLDKYIINAYREWGLCYNIIKGICEGLQYLHENHIIHLDLKPANILLDNNMIPKITDFGISRCFDKDQSRHITKTILGTIGYLAPELLNGGVITRSADLYSLGVIIIEILTGQKGYQATEDVLTSWSDRLESSQRDTLCQQIRLCNETAAECIAFNPEKRPASARNIIDRFREMESIQMVEAGSSTSAVKGESNTDDPAPGVSSKELMGMKTHLIPSEAYSDSQYSGNEYYSPELMYIKVCVIAAHDLIGSEKGQPLAPTITKIQMGSQIRQTQPGQPQGSANTEWNEEFMLVTSEPFEDPLVVTVEENVAGGTDKPIGHVIIPLASPYVSRNDLAMSVPSKWFSLSSEVTVEEEAPDVTMGLKNDEDSRKMFTSKIDLRISLETAYHVLDESTQYISDVQPAAKDLWKSAIGILEVGILSARNLTDMKNPYCVAKYGSKWVRTRTLLDTASPQWKEQYMWDVFDLSTVITVAVFDNANVHHGHGHGDAKDQRIGKVRVRLGTLESGRMYTHYYPLMALSPSELTKMGELQLAVRFTCKSWAKMLTMYGETLLPRINHTNPISEPQADYLRLQAVQMVATSLSKAEPPLRREVVEYMLEIDSHMFSLRRSNANFDRINSVFSDAVAIYNWVDGTCKWRNPITTILVHCLFLILMYHPELIPTTIFMNLSISVALNYWKRPRTPPDIDTVLPYADPDELDEEFDTLPTSKPDDILRPRYERLRSLAGKVQKAMGDLATELERAQYLLSWRDPRVTLIFMTVLLVLAFILYSTPFRMVAMVTGLYFLRPPWLRSRNNLLFILYSRLPSCDDSMIL